MVDISSEYVKMCEKAYKHMPPKKPEVWDYWWTYDDREDKYGVFVISAYETDGGFYGPGIGSYGSNLDGWDLKFPIFRQDQLQEMVIDSFREHWGEAIYPGLMEEAVGFARQYPYESMEQLWLAFVMKEKYNKVWDKKEWVRE